MLTTKKELLISYIKSNTSPILIDTDYEFNILNSITLPADCKGEELVGHYDETEYVPPKWLTQLLKIKEPTVLIIDKIDSIPKEEQTKFIEILKYRKVSTFEIPKNVVIILTATTINEKTINEEVYSLVAHIRG